MMNPVAALKLSKYCLIGFILELFLQFSFSLLCNHFSEQEELHECILGENTLVTIAQSVLIQPSVLEELTCVVDQGHVGHRTKLRRRASS